MNRFQKLVVAAWLSIIVLVAAGSIVRATGSGLGCPDWPRCWGCLIPPTEVENINFDKIDIEKFRKKAAQHGRDPESITVETLRGEFDARATWIEYINRLLAMPASLLTLAVLIGGFFQSKQGRPVCLYLGILSALIILGNALLGAKVVSSGLKPGVITLHMALAMLLVCVFIYTAWRGSDKLWRVEFKAGAGLSAKRVMIVLFGLTVIEGILGSQVREMTDSLALSHIGEVRSEWIWELEQSWSYLFHRSFSWVIFALTIVFYVVAKKTLKKGSGWLEQSILFIVVAQMVLGVVMAHVQIFRSVQVLHVVLSSLLLSVLFLWLIGAKDATRDQSEMR